MLLRYGLSVVCWFLHALFAFAGFSLTGFALNASFSNSHFWVGSLSFTFSASKRDTD